MGKKICRWGILSAAGIAHRNWESIRNAENATLVAVASRDVAKAQAFIDACQSQVPFEEKPSAIEGYEELIASEDIDAVYVPLPTGLRKEWVIKAARAGKHVLCEKPCAIHGDDLAEMVEVCREAGVQFMDGVMYMHSDRMGAIRNVLDDGESVGQIKRITSQFSFRAPDDFFEGNIRSDPGLEPAGCLGDLGWYTIRLSLWAMRYAMPTSVSGRMLASSAGAWDASGVPTEFSGELFFEGGVSAGFYNSFLTEHQQWANISGSGGNLTVSDFVLPYFDSKVGFDVSNAVFAIDRCKFTMERHVREVAVAEHATNHPSAQETKLFRTFSALANGGVPDPHWPEASLKTQRVLDACLLSAREGGRLVEVG